MPELPEVETIRLGLRKLLSGQVIIDVECDNPKSFPNDDNLVALNTIGAQVIEIDRRGKGLIIMLNTGFSLLIHLKMTGQLVFRPKHGTGFGGGHPTDSLINSLPDKSTRVTLTFRDGSKLFFNDQRKFGWMKLIATSEINNDSFIARLGPEALADDFDFITFKNNILRRKNTTIKAAILDQSVLAGVGNIYADEGLFLARIHPSTLVRQVSTIKLKRLYVSLRAVMQKSIDLGGSSDRNYVDAEGNKGSYLKFAQVFRRDDQPCPECGTPIRKIRVAGRGTHICPRCQVKSNKAL